MAFARLYISKFSRGKMPLDSPYDTRLGCESGKLTSASPKFRGPYAYGYNTGKYLKQTHNIAIHLLRTYIVANNVQKEGQNVYSLWFTSAPMTLLHCKPLRVRCGWKLNS